MKVLKDIVSNPDCFSVEYDDMNHWCIILKKPYTSYDHFSEVCNRAELAIDRALTILLVEELKQHDPGNYMLKSHLTDPDKLYLYKYVI